VELELAALFATGNRQLACQRLGVHADTHAADLERAAERLMPEQQVAVQRPVIVVGRAAIVRFAGSQRRADALDERGMVLGHELVLALLGRQVGVQVLEFLRGDEGDVSIELGFELRVIPLQLVERAANRGDDAAHHFLQILGVTLRLQHDLFPVPLVDVNGMQVVELLVAADGVHIAHDAFPHVEVVTLEGIALPLGKRMHDFGVIADGGHVEAHGALDAIEVVIQAGLGIYDERCCHAHEVQRRAQLGQEHMLDALDGPLCVVQRKLRLIALGNGDHDFSFVLPASRYQRHDTPKWAALARIRQILISFETEPTFGCNSRNRCITAVNAKRCLGGATRREDV